MIRSVRCHNLAALAQSDDPGELVHPRPVDAGLRFRFTFQIVTKLDLRQVVCPSSRPSLQWVMTGKAHRTDYRNQTDRRNPSRPKAGRIIRGVQRSRNQIRHVQR